MSDYIALTGLAINSLTRRKLRAYLTIIGIFIGIASIIALVSLGQGLRLAIADIFSGFGPDLLMVQIKQPGFLPPGASTASQLEDSDARVIESVAGVEVIAKRTIRIAEMQFKKKSDMLFVSYLPDEPRARELVITASKADIGQGRLVEKGDSGKILIGSAYSQSDNRFGKALEVDSKVLLNGKEFNVEGILKKTGRQSLDRVLLMTEKDFNDLFDSKDAIGVIVVRAAQGEDPAQVAERITKELRKHRGQKEGKEDFEVQTAGQIFSTFGIVLNIVQAVLIGIAAISLMVGGIGVMNTMYTAVLERTREIGIMKAIGARNMDIFFLFFIESGLIGAIGGGIGIILGIGMAKLVEVGGQFALGTMLLKADITLTLIFGALAFSFIVGSISGTLPALQAARTQPAEALRK